MNLESLNLESLNLKYLNTNQLKTTKPEKNKKKGQKQMCTVSIDIDEAVIRDLLPELDTTAAIRLWAQELIDSRMQQMQLEDEETMDVEELRAMLHETVRKEYARP